MKNPFKNRIKIKTVGIWGEIDNIVHLALVIQAVCGHQVLDPNWSLKKVLKKFILTIFLFTYATLGTFDFLKSTTDPELIAEVYFTLNAIIVFPIKFLLFFKNRRIFCELYVYLKTDITDDIKANSDLYLVLRKAKNLIRLIFAMAIIPITGYELFSLWGYMRGNLNTLSRTTTILMPMKTPYFEIGWILHSMFYLQINTMGILDIWFVLLSFFLCAASDGLVNILNVDKKTRDETEVEYRARLSDTLRRFYICHVRHAKFLSTLYKMYEWHTLVLLYSAAMCICIILISISNAGQDINWKFALHGLPMMAQIFAYNYFGETIKTKASDVKQALMSYDWTSLSVRDRKSYYVIVTYVNTEFCIKTVTGTDLSFITMTSILQVTYRAFTMLQSV